MIVNTTTEGRQAINEWYKAVTAAEGGTPRQPNRLLVLIGPKGSGKRTISRAIKDAVERGQESICSVFTQSAEAPVDFDALLVRFKDSPTILVLEDLMDFAQVESVFGREAAMVKMPAIAEPGNHDRIYRELRGQIMGAGI